jgi:hypothetical protein
MELLEAALYHALYGVDELTQLFRAAANDLDLWLKRDGADPNAGGESYDEWRLVQGIERFYPARSDHADVTLRLQLEIFERLIGRAVVTADNRTVLRELWGELSGPKWRRIVEARGTGLIDMAERLRDEVQREDPDNPGPLDQPPDSNSERSILVYTSDRRVL